MPTNAPLTFTAFLSLKFCYCLQPFPLLCSAVLHILAPPPPLVCSSAFLCFLFSLALILCFALICFSLSFSIGLAFLLLCFASSFSSLLRFYWHFISSMINTTAQRASLFVLPVVPISSRSCSKCVSVSRK